MKSDLHSRVALELEEQAKHWQRRRDAYSHTSSHYAFADGQFFAFRDLAKSIRQGDFSPLDGAGYLPSSVPLDLSVRNPNTVTLTTKSDPCPKR